MTDRTLDQASMAGLQHASPPPWRQRSRTSLLWAVTGGPRQWVDGLRQLLGLVAGLVWPPRVRARLRRLVTLGHIDVIPTTAQILLAARDQMMLGAVEETKLFYRSQDIPWFFHNLRRFLSGPATVLDPAGLFSPRDTIILHVMQTFHRHPVYDLVLLRGFPDGLAEMSRQVEQLQSGTHKHQAALESLIEDGSYHARLGAEVASFCANPLQPARPIPSALVSDPVLMLAMDQFKDLRGYTAYAARLPGGWAGWIGALTAWLIVAFNGTVGGLFRVKLGPRHIRIACCDPDLIARHLPDLQAESDTSSQR